MHSFVRIKLPPENNLEEGIKHTFHYDNFSVVLMHFSGVLWYFYGVFIYERKIITINRNKWLKTSIFELLKYMNISIIFSFIEDYFILHSPLYFIGRSKSSCNYSFITYKSFRFKASFSVKYLHQQEHLFY